MIVIEVCILFNPVLLFENLTHLKQNNSFNLRVLLFCASHGRELSGNGLCRCVKWLFWQRWFVETFAKAQHFFSGFDLVPETCWGLLQGTAQGFHCHHCVLELCVFLLVELLRFSRVSQACCSRGWHQHSGSGSTGMCSFWFRSVSGIPRIPFN